MSLISSAIHSIIVPPQRQEYQYSDALSATNLQRLARIVRVAAFSFAYLTLSTAAVILEVKISLWPLALGIGLAGLVALGVFWFINQKDENYIAGLTTDLRTSLAKSEIQRILSNSKDAYNDATALRKALRAANRVLGHDLIDNNALNLWTMIWEHASPKQTIIEAACALGIDLRMQYHQLITEPGRFGWPACEYDLKMNWDGQSAESFDFDYVIVKKETETTPLLSKKSDPEKEQSIVTNEPNHDPA